MGDATAAVSCEAGLVLIVGIEGMGGGPVEVSGLYIMRLSLFEAFAMGEGNRPGGMGSRGDDCADD
jgi:hypothetical protein